MAECKVQNQSEKSQLTAVLVRGIPGSGKSLLCQTLVNLLGGQHLSQDEVEAKYAGQQNVTPFQIFLQLVESTASRPSVRYLFVDSKLSSKSSREGISAAVACGFAQRNIRSLNGLNGGDAEETPNLKVVLLSLARAETGDEIQLCAARILQRSLKHVALIPHAAQERVILDAICKDEEPIRPEEADAFDVCKTVDMSLPASLVVSSALEVLPCISVYMPEQISSAIQVAQKVEKDLSLRWTTLYWKVEILQQHVSVLLSDLAPWLNETCNAIEAQHTVKAQQLEDLHVTVLWTGFDADSEQKLLEFEGQEVGIAVTSICCDVELGLVAVRVSLDHIQSLCESPDPHITVAKLPGVAAKQSNGVLLRHRRGDTSVLHYEFAPLRVKGIVQRQLSVESMAAGTAALASTLPQGNPLCELGLAASRKSFDILATEGPSFASDFMLSLLSSPTCRVSQPLQHCRWPPKLPGKVWLTIHEFPVTQSRLMLELMEKAENNQIFSSLEVAVSYMYVAENLLQKTYPKLLGDLEQRCSGRCLESLQHAYRCLNHWRPQDSGKSPSFCLRCTGAGGHSEKLEQGLVAVIGKTGWTHSPGAPLTINVEFKEDWILLSLAAPKTHAASPVVESLAPEKVATPEVPAIAVPAGSAMEGGILKIDGSFLGGGRGHILRSAMTYAAVLGISVGVHNIRKSSVGETGLQPRDAAILEGLTKLAGGKIQGGTVGSPFVTFHSSASNLDCDSFVINTGSGALTHAVQAALPVMLSRSAALGGSEVEVCFRGATNLCRWNGEGGFEILPPIEYMKLVLFPVLRRLFGITLALDVRRKGFGSLGEVFVRASADQWPLPCFEMLDRGEAASLSGVTYSSAGIPRNVLSRFLQGQLRKKDAGAAIVFKEALPPLPQHFTCQGDLPNDDGVACGLVLAIITTSGCCFGGDSMGRKGVAAEAVGEEAARKAVLAFQRGGCADEHLEDQLVVFMTMAAGTSRLRLGSCSTSRSLHMQTALWLAERFGATVRFVQDADGPVLEIDGIGDRLS